MTSKKYKQLIREIAEELNLPYNAVNDAVKGGYKSLWESVVELKPKEVHNGEDYDKLPEKLPMQYIGGFHKITKRQLLKINEYYDK